jgi:hypothetical protein
MVGNLDKQSEGWFDFVVNDILSRETEEENLKIIQKNHDLMVQIESDLLDEVAKRN